MGQLNLSHGTKFFCPNGDSSWPLQQTASAAAPASPRTHICYDMPTIQSYIVIKLTASFSNEEVVAAAHGTYFFILFFVRLVFSRINY